MLQLRNLTLFTRPSSPPGIPQSPHAVVTLPCILVRNLDITSLILPSVNPTDSFFMPLIPFWQFLPQPQELSPNICSRFLLFLSLLPPEAPQYLLANPDPLNLLFSNSPHLPFFTAMFPNFPDKTFLCLL